MPVLSFSAFQYNTTVKLETALAVLGTSFSAFQYNTTVKQKASNTMKKR